MQNEYVQHIVENEVHELGIMMVMLSVYAASFKSGNRLM